jgi:putative oxygen-independent coproporphyrinogen III oxidase
MQPVSLYLHIPFCVHRCAYCDFNTYAGLDHLIPDYVEALRREMDIISRSAGEKLSLKTIFFGGGTPSLLTIPQLERVLQAINTSFRILPGSEITLEANPGTLSLDYLSNLVLLGVNRLSLGMQSANVRELRLLERQHNFLDVIQAVKWARQAGLDNINLDLIFGLPNQTLEEWGRNLSQAVQLNPDHLSLYALTLEHGTPMEHWVMRGLLSQPDQDAAADMYEYSMDTLGRYGYIQYEISNWAREGQNGTARVCLHNLQYWRNLPYIGVGAGAHGYLGGFRVANVLAPGQYIRRYAQEADDLSREFPQTPSTVNMDRIEQKDEIAETMMMGLRLVQEGVPADLFFRRFNRSLEDVFEDQINELIRMGLLEWATGMEKSLRLTPRGRLLGNQVFMRFI